MAVPRIGISGWRYKPWRGTFYPKGLAQHRELEYASRQLNSIEINGSFYSLQRPDSYREWHDDTPDDFLFAVKANRFITHMKRLKDIEAPLANFFSSGVLALGKKLGPFLWQFPPNMQLSMDRFDTFLRLLPRDMAAAAALGTKHEARMKGRTFLDPPKNRKLRHAVEIRNETFMVPEFFALLRAHNVAFVLADTAGIWPYSEDVTADFLYLRLHGAEQLYSSGYTEAALDWWAARIMLWQAGHEPRDAKHVLDKSAKKRKSRDVYVYFDNDAKVHAPYDAINLFKRVK